MQFTATRHENGATIKCEADNVVMRDDLDKPIHDSQLLEVMCKFQKYFKHIFSNFPAHLLNVHKKNHYMLIHRVYRSPGRDSETRQHNGKRDQGFPIVLRV